MTTDVTDAVDVAAYFDRIGYRGPAEPTVETVHALVAAHNRSIPFENLDPLLGIPVADLSAAALTDKLVHRRRGGYCYEHNGLMGYVLEELGFGVERLAGRVVWMNPERPASCADASGAVRDGAGCRRASSGRCRVRRTDADVADSAGGQARCRKRAMSRTASASAVTATSWRPRSAVSGSRCTCSPRARNRGSISKSEVGMCQRIPTRSSSQA